MAVEQHSKWFETWFDSPYYPILYKNRDCSEAESFIRKLVDHLHLSPKDSSPASNLRVLDLACGRGRHSFSLNQLGFDVTGIDLSQQSIAYAKKCENDHLHFYVHDMRKLFRTNYFDAVLNLFTSLGYFEKEKDELAVIDSACKALKPGGIFILDFFNAGSVIQQLKPFEEITVEGIKFMIHKKSEGDFIIKQISFSDKGKEYHFEERVKALTLAHFEKYLSASNLKIVNLWGNYRLDAFNPLTSERLIIVAKK